MSKRSALLVLVMLASACTDSRTTTRRDGGGGDGGPPAPPPGELTLAVQAVAWSDAGSALVVSVRVGNGAGADPAPLAPTYFALALSGGAELTGAASPLSASACRADLAVGAGGTVTCELLFQAVVGAPQQIHFRPPERSASAPIEACSAATPSGLCDAGSVCRSGACAPRCSSSFPDGACASDGELCVGGSCAPRCSPSVPSGACEEGACRDGACDTSCRRLDTAAPGCTDCLIPVVSGDSACGLASDACLDCIYCPFDTGLTDCECLADEVCSVCGAEAQAFWDCGASLCPSCV